MMDIRYTHHDIPAHTTPYSTTTTDHRSRQPRASTSSGVTSSSWWGAGCARVVVRRWGCARPRRGRVVSGGGRGLEGRSNDIIV